LVKKTINDRIKTPSDQGFFYVATGYKKIPSNKPATITNGEGMRVNDSKQNVPIVKPKFKNVLSNG
jgi:hypothetical protein